MFIHISLKRLIDYPAWTTRTLRTHVLRIGHDGSPSELVQKRSMRVAEARQREVLQVLFVQTDMVMIGRWTQKVMLKVSQDLVEETSEAEEKTRTTKTSIVSLSVAQDEGKEDGAKEEEILRGNGGQSLLMTRNTQDEAVQDIWLNLPLGLLVMMRIAIMAGVQHSIQGQGPKQIQEWLRTTTERLRLMTIRLGIFKEAMEL